MIGSLWYCTTDKAQQARLEKYGFKFIKNLRLDQPANVPVHLALERPHQSSLNTSTMSNINSTMNPTFFASYNNIANTNTMYHSQMPLEHSGLSSQVFPGVPQQQIIYQNPVYNNRMSPN